MKYVKHVRERSTTRFFISHKYFVSRHLILITDDSYKIDKNVNWTITSAFEIILCQWQMRGSFWTFWQLWNVGNSYL